MLKSLLALSLVLLLNTSANAAFNGEEVAKKGKPGDSASFSSEAIHLAQVLAENSEEVAKLLKDHFTLGAVKIELIKSNAEHLSSTHRYTLKAYRFDRNGLEPFSGTTRNRSLVLDGVENYSRGFASRMHYTSSGVRTHESKND